MMGLLLVFILSLAIPVWVDADLVSKEKCLCSVNHPQQLFCESDFAIVGTVESKQDYQDIFSYEISIFDNKVFKGLSYVGAKATSATVLTPSGDSLCGRTNLELEETYLFTGGFYEGKLVITFCDWIQLWNDITPEQKSYLEHKNYLNHCGLCEIDSVKSELKINQNDNDEVYGGQVSGLWTPYGCYYNPVSSATYGNKKDCETSYSYCHPTIAGRCDWELTPSYEECFSNRESYWSDRHRLPALRIPYTTLKQCREIVNDRKLKRRCISEVKAYLRSQRAKMDPADMLEELLDIRDMWMDDENDDLGLLND